MGNRGHAGRAVRVCQHHDFVGHPHTGAIDNSDTYTYPDVGPHARTDSDTDEYPNSPAGGRAYSHTYAYSDTDADAYCHAHAHAHAHGYTYAKFECGVR